VARTAVPGGEGSAVGDAHPVAEVEVAAGSDGEGDVAGAGAEPKRERVPLPRAGNHDGQGLLACSWRLSRSP
jgi:predicted RecA/RadA family phage recombinase